MKRSTFNLSNTKTSSTRMGELTPFAITEVLPGDSFKVSTSMLLRFMPLDQPVMHAFDLHVHHWFVPNRILWDSWEEFIVNVETTKTVPTLALAKADDAAKLYFADLMDCGIPKGLSTDWTASVNSLPFRAYNKIWNEFYRDQDLHTKLNEHTGDTGDVIADYGMQKVCWKKDYFTIAREKAQKGTGGSVTITSTVAGTTATGTLKVEDYRVASAKQSIEEHRNRFGSRYTDYLRFLGITPSDARLQRPEYLGGGKQVISISEVLTTSQGKTGQMAGHGIAALRTRPFKRFFEEHGFIMSLMFLRPQNMYGDVSPRFYGYSKPNDFWQKEDEFLGQQSIDAKELYRPATSATFGWVGRHDQYRHSFSKVTGFLKNDTFKDWTAARLWTSAPALNGVFVTCTPPRRIFQDQNDTSPDFMMMAANNMLARRLVSKFPRH